MKTILLGIFFLCFFSATAFSQEKVLSGGWFLKPDNELKVSSEILSSSGFLAKDWLSAKVPSTVMGTLVNHHLYRDPFFARNLDSIDSQPFHGPWWYRTTFHVDRELLRVVASLLLDGINYRAEVWLNGHLVADTSHIYGAYRTFTLDISPYLLTGSNVLAIKVYPPRSGDFTVGFVDWNRPSPDHYMGLFRPVRIRFSRQVSLNSVFVRTKVDTKTLKLAKVEIRGELENHSDTALSVVLKGTIEHRLFSASYLLKPHESRSVILSADNTPSLLIRSPRLWYPYTMGEPELYTLKLQVDLSDGKVSDQVSQTFGIREVTSYRTAQGYLGFKINGRRIQIRGGGWADDLFLREDSANLASQLAYVKAMNLNSIRLEGFWGSSQALYDLCDRMGILVMAGWSCQWEWASYVGKPADEFGSISSAEDINFISDCWRDQVKMLRNHPSLFLWVYGSDKLPRPALENHYLSILKNEDDSRPFLASCANKISTVTGRTGVKMEGPYDYVTPNYWYEDKTHGGAYGFNTETSPGPEIPPLESLERMLPKDSLWPVNPLWNYHCSMHAFSKLDNYLNALNARYGQPSDLNDLLKKADVVNYETMKAMYEAFSVNRDSATGIVQWMLNSAWPRMYWQLYDYYLTPFGAFFGAQAALKPLNLVYNYGNQIVYLCSDRMQRFKELKAIIRIFDSRSHLVMEKTLNCDALPDSSIGITRLNFPSTTLGTEVFFAFLDLLDASGKEISHNVYWVAEKKDVLDEAGSNWYVTPNKSYADFTHLQSLPMADCKVLEIKRQHLVHGEKVYFLLRNETDKVAFFLKARIVDQTTNKTILPVIWNENDLTLPPHGARMLEASFPNQDHHPVKLLISGWNISAKEVALWKSSFVASEEK